MLDRWIDFARGLAEPAEWVRMLEHLAAGCSQCQRDVDFWTEVGQICQHPEAPDVPESLTRLAKAIFPVRMAEMPARGTQLPIEVIYDSFLVPAPAGLGTTWPVGWRGLYRTGDCSVGLRIEPERRFRRAAVIGQITNRVLPEVEMGNIPVSLRSGKQVVAEAVSNRFGEFQMEYEQQAHLRLCIYLEGGSKSIQVPLKRVTGEKPARIHRARDTS